MKGTNQTYFDKPTQVWFFNAYDAATKDDGTEWICGIAFEDYIICGECGAKIDIEDLLEEAADFTMEYIMYEMEWVNIHDEIAGDTLPPPLVNAED